MHDPLSDYLDDVAENLAFKLWSFGHYHVSARPFFAGSSGLFSAEYETFREIPRVPSKERAGRIASEHR